MSKLLSGLTIVITGAARGLGESFARAIANAGAKLVLCDRLTDELQQTAASLRLLGAEVHAFTMDLAQPDSIRNTFAAIAENGPIHGLVNNAAIATGVGGKSMMEHDIELWDQVMQVNVRGTWLVSQAAVPLLERAGGGKIVNVASDTALWGAPNLMAYVASKGAVIAMTRSMARELGTRKICVNAIAPGLTRVEATAYVPADRHLLYENGRALSREQYPQDVDGSVIFLLSSLADFVTGQLLPVNGGFTFN